MRATSSDLHPSLVAPPVSYVRAVLVGVAGMVVGMLYALLIGPAFGVIVGVPTAIAVAWMRNRGKAVRVVRQVAALMAGGAMLLLVVLGLGNSAEVSTAGSEPENVSLGWVVPLSAALWSAGWAYLLSVWRPPVVVEVDKSERDSEQRPE